MTVIRLMLAGLQLLTFQRVALQRFQVGYLTVGMAVLATLAAGAAFEFWFGFDWQEFRPTGVVLQLGRWAAISFGVGLVAAWANKSAVGPAIAAVTAVSFWVTVVSWGLNLAVHHYGNQIFGKLDPAWLFGLYALPVSMGVVLLLIGAMRAMPLVLERRARQLGFAVFGLLAGAHLLLPAMPLLREGYGNEYDRSWLVSMAWSYGVEQGWIAMPVREASDEPRPRAFNAEELLGKQPALLDRQLAMLDAERPHHRDLYLLGFAGYGWQGVFRREVEAVDRLFAKRFDTLGRSLQLINNAQTVDQLPLAGPHNLTVALQRLGEKMNKDEDVLFLFMTSHGGPGTFSVTMEDMPFRDITPKALKGMLDRSGIKNRVIVLSACFSGSFVKDVADDNTLLITAARPDRTSFGCADKAEWTYFGDAFFNHALREAKSFPAAFETARKLVAGWEATQGLKPSEPQISIGRHIEAVLTDLSVGPADLIEVAERR